MSTIIVAVLVTLLAQFISCGYMTHTYIKSDSQINSIVSCKNYRNAIYTTYDGKIHVWIDMDQTKSYTIRNGKTIINQLVCSRYGESLQNNFIGGLAWSTGEVIVWEEVVNNSNKFDHSYTVQLRQLNFTYNLNKNQSRDCLISIGSHYLAIGSKVKNNVLIYNLLHLDLPPVVVSVPGNLTNMVLDRQQNLAIVFQINNIHYFSYYVQVYESLEETQSIQLLGYSCSSSQRPSIDYRLSQQQNISLEYSVYCQKYDSLKMIKIKTGSKKPSLILSSQYRNSILLECKSMIKYCFEQLTGLQQNNICMDSGTIKMNTYIIDYCCSQDFMYGNHIIYVASYLNYVSYQGDYYVDVLEDYTFVRFWLFISIAICLACLLCLHVTICQHLRCFFAIWNLCFCVAPDGQSCGFGTQHQICESLQN